MNTDFLLKLDNSQEKEKYVRLIALSWDEYPIETIEGRATGGTINIDGSSAIRRTCNLSLVANELNINEFYWGIKSKFKLEIGLKNNIDDSYEDIIWFNQGIYVFTSFNTSHTTQGYVINASGKDKMCLLNGELGGNLYASIDFGVKETVNLKDNTIEYNKIPIAEILKEGIHTYAMEPYSNIILNDLDELGLELLEYRGNTSMYVFINHKDGNDTEAVNITMNPEMELIVNNETIRLGEFKDKGYYFDNLFQLDSNFTGIEPTKVSIKVGKDYEEYTIAEITYGQALGYRISDLVYPGDLISSVGEAFTSILDKIKNMLVDFEYFYDIDGRFIFQRKATYINKSWTPIKESNNDQYVENAVYSNLISYYFENSNLVTSFSHNPQLNNVKNDYSIWGHRKGINGAEIPIHFRYAIDKKPIYYCSPYQDKNPIYSIDDVDWRELIFQMAVDYFAHHTETDFESKIAKFNKEYYPIGITGYEHYYTDVQGFWRQVYDGKEFLKEVEENPENLNFWIDFLDTSGELEQFSIRVIGDRIKAVNDKDINSIYYKEIPKLIFASQEEWGSNKLLNFPGYTPVRWGSSNLESLCTISAQGKSAKDKLNELLYQHGYCSESITLQAVPIYYLQPNTRIQVRDELSNINGQYLISRITLPITHNGTMSITATKIPERII